jgi:hypothetical protein
MTSPQELRATISSGLLSFPLSDLKPADVDRLGRLISKLGPQ